MGLRVKESARRHFFFISLQSTPGPFEAPRSKLLYGGCSILQMISRPTGEGADRKGASILLRDLMLADFGTRPRDRSRRPWIGSRWREWAFRFGFG
jgi:hypothetical protein